LLEREENNKEVIVQTGDKNSVKAFPTRKLTFFIRDSNSPTLTLRDFSSIIDDIESAFQAALKISGAAPSDLIILGLDSGSEKSLDVAGIAEAVDKLSTFFLEAGDRIRFSRSSKARANIKAASDGLSLLNELRASQEKGSVSPEEAEKLRRTLLKSVDDLFTKGVYTREMQESLPLKPNQVTYQRTKLITHYGDVHTGDDRAANPSDGPNYQTNDLSEEE
jgi:hypothetical protein